MAGYALGFDEGGAIPDDAGESWSPDQDDNSGAVPVVGSAPQEDDNSGALPVVGPAQQEQPQQSRSGVDFNAAHVPGNAKRIIQYLMGADAAPPPAADKFKQGVKAEHPDINHDGDANLIAVHKAAEGGGDEAAWSMVQYNRMAYNAKQAFAKAALMGGQGKPPDIQAAANAATQASHHILDGSQAVFIANPNGVTATVKLPGTTSRVSYNLTPQQFNEYLDVGGTGQWDKLRENGGIPTALQKIAGARPQQQQSGSQDDRGTQAPDTSHEGNYPNSGVTDLSGGGKQDYSQWDKMANPDYDPQNLARAQQQFHGDQAKQAQWLTGQEGQEATRENELAKAQVNVQGRREAAHELGEARRDAAKTTGDSRVEAQRVKSESYAKAQQQKAALALQKMAQEAKSANERNRINVAMRLIGNPNWATQLPKERDTILQTYGLDKLGVPLSEAPEIAPTQTSPPAAAPSQQQARPGRLKLPDGKYYIKGPDGKAMLDPNQ